jgi:TRAP-type mannitol/chloroaromatic compound transport system permease small subunit
MKILLAFARIVDAVNERCARIAAWLTLIACLISCGNALARYLLGVSSNAWLEIQWYLFGALVMLGASWTLNRNEHVRVDVVYGRLSTRAQLWVDLLGAALFLLPATALIGWLSWPMFFNSWHIGEVSPNAGGLLRWPIKIFVPLGMALLTLQGLSEIIKRVAALTGDAPLPPHYERPLQ